ncbi:PilZ domain-containing protein [Shewanella sp. AS1]|uniref:PilZ domain-containing protein n=1 Tax=Shewanella sp. AS1 TaxID=2907626 RepID=UPI001F44BFD4|nr:PilZ domain-containing protein [Shewanella sp. AS1]MCE9679113.1 PilZ domain-containing protein [Shewanella sp. AS1]
MSVEQHNALIEQLKPLLMEQDFQELFDHLTAQESNSTRFLIKMELNRLATPCTRVIDLRDKSELPCEPIEHGQQSHFMDTPAKNSFIEALGIYQNHYTLGVYEHVLSTHKQRRKKERRQDEHSEPEPQPFIASGAVLGSYFNRSEERMNYAIRIQVSQPGSNEIGGITVDLSVSGARIRLPLNHGLNIGQPLRVKLLDLSKEYYYDDLQKGVDYQVVDVETNHEYSWMRLKRLGGSEGLSEMIANLIQGYKFRYKVDINDILVAATGLGLERHYLPHLPHLPLYVEQIERDYKVTHGLTSLNNQALLQRFNDEKGICQLPGLLTSSRLKRLIEAPNDITHQLLFCFTFHAQGEIYFYSASLAELIESDLLGLFISFGANKSNWRILKLSSHEIDHQTSYKASILPGDSSYYSALTETQLKHFTHVLQLMDLTNEAMLAQYRQWDNKGYKANLLKQFGQHKVSENQIKFISLQFGERRNEPRFSFKTQVSISQDGKPTVSGITQDISGKGLQIILDEPVQWQPRTPLLLSFTTLQSLAGKTKLEQLPYRIVRSQKNGTLLHLAAMISHEPHIGVAFFNKLIEVNRDKLKKLTQANGDLKELSDGMKNLLMRELASVLYFAEKTTKSAKLALLGVSKYGNDVSDIFAALTANVLQYDLSALLENGRLKQDFIDPIKRLKPQQGLEYFEVYLQISRQSQGGIRLICRPPEEIGDAQRQQHFIRQSQDLGQFMALRIYRGAASKPDLNYIKRELEYIGVHAQHKAKNLEQLLWHIIGIGEFVDITPEVMLRFPELACEQFSQLE